MSEQYLGHGRSKNTANAKVRLIKDGKGAFEVNGKSLESYFNGPRYAALRKRVQEAFDICEMDTNAFSVNASVKGGGLSGQARAIAMAIARGMVSYDEGLRSNLRDKVKRVISLLTQPALCKERKKVGHRGARKVRQFSKR